MSTNKTPADGPRCDPGGTTPEVNNDPPAQDVLNRIDTDGLTLIDREGKTHSFKSLYDGPESKARVFFIFVRHFFCPPCQEYLQELFKHATPETLPKDTTIIVVGHGEAPYIDKYAKITGSPFPIYSDPTRRLHDALGLARANLNGSIAKGYLHFGRVLSKSLFQIFSQTPSLGEAGKGRVLEETPWGDPRQQGADMLFEPSASGGKEVTFIRRCKNSEDHEPVPDLLKVLGVAKPA